MARPGLRPRLAAPGDIQPAPAATPPRKRRRIKGDPDEDASCPAHPPPARRSRIKVEHEVQNITKAEVSKASVSEVASKLEELREWGVNHAPTYEAIRCFRKTVVAPVDHSGCAMLGRKELGDKVYRFEVLVALILSAQTPDLKLGPLVREIQSRFETGITAAALLATPADDIRAWLQPIGMQNQKTKALLGASELCVDEHAGDIPPTFDELLKLPGVGPKIAALVMSNAWHQNVAIGVDTHVHRISNRLGWTKTKTPELTMRALMDLVPQAIWGEMNPALVGFGQTQCFARNPSCGNCPVRDRCPRILPPDTFGLYYDTHPPHLTLSQSPDHAFAELRVLDAQIRGLRMSVDYTRSWSRLTLLMRRAAAWRIHFVTMLSTTPGSFPSYAWSTAFPCQTRVAMRRRRKSSGARTKNMEALDKAQLAAERVGDHIEHPQAACKLIKRPCDILFGLLHDEPQPASIHWISHAITLDHNPSRTFLGCVQGSEVEDKNLHRRAHDDPLRQG
ncbi:hypothetical protein HDU87_003420 [Geranomyces variabilis]|uniref:DNA-(apurinic or apyrimidinic site) lyase n=1 Tax=Geranomyces variabilis TaxID=109894 RepID=A0AAD5TKB1_9FUNG|nr:hypothetical protein HDU87_003420 [Geranomyces variabilis]